jgi:predicted glycosyltransferase
MRVLIAVTHLLGTGHLARALTLARAIQAAGDQALVVSGGMPVPQLDRGDVPILQLPPVRSNGVDFSRLRDVDGAFVTDQILSNRQSILCQTLIAERPDALITELYPFGRRILRAEFAALLDAAHALPQKPIICASVRDILAPPSKPKKADAARAILTRSYDRVLVHSDADLMPLNLSWPITPEIQGMLSYTGFVAPETPPAHPENLGKDEIIVSAGGGDVGKPLFDTILSAAPHLPLRNFRLLVGGAKAAETIAELNSNAPDNVFAEPARSDFRMMLNHAAASISLCGYNTALDVLQTGCPAVFLPFDAGNEVEQSIRARALAHQDGIAMINSPNLSIQAVLDALANVIAAPPRAPLTTNIDGAAETHRILRKLVSQNQ